MLKKKLIAEGKLDKHGKPNEETPKEYLRSLPDLAAAAKPAAAAPAAAAAVAATPEKAAANGKDEDMAEVTPKPEGARLLCTGCCLLMAADHCCCLLASATVARNGAADVCQKSGSWPVV
jgi:hypothetical protein